MPCIKLQGFFQKIPILKLYKTFIGSFCFLASDKTLDRTSTCILLCTDLSENLSTLDLLLFLMEFCFHYVRCIWLYLFLRKWYQYVNVVWWNLLSSFFLFVIIFSNKQSRTCTLREAVIVGSVLQEASVPPFDSRYNFMRNLWCARGCSVIPCLSVVPCAFVELWKLLFMEVYVCLFYSLLFYLHF